MKYTLVIFALLLVGCRGIMPTNEYLIKQNKACVDAGMLPVAYYDNGFSGGIVDIKCFPKETK
jgi:hypothetical protein